MWSLAAVRGPAQAPACTGGAALMPAARRNPHFNSQGPSPPHLVLPPRYPPLPTCPQAGLYLTLCAWALRALQLTLTVAIHRGKSWFQSSVLAPHHFHKPGESGVQICSKVCTTTALPDPWLPARGSPYLLSWCLLYLSYRNTDFQVRR